MPSPSQTVAAILLTGGSSRRMGRDKSQLLLEGRTLACRAAELLRSVTEIVIEVGPGITGLPSTREEVPGAGPLAAVVAGQRRLRELDHRGASLVVACDLPYLTEPLLRLLVEWESTSSIVPVVRGRAQPLCARWARRDLEDAHDLLEAGVRSLRHLQEVPDVVLIDESEWGRVASEEAFSDVDSPEDLRRLGLSHLLDLPPHD